MINKINRELVILSNRARFIKDIIDERLKINNVPRQVINDYLEKNKFEKVDDSYSYLLSMSIHTLTKERFEELLKDVELKKTELETIQKTDPKDMYLNDLEILKKSLK
jgi:DNA topoisomerase-2